MHVGSANFLPPAAFRSLIRAVENALQPACVRECVPAVPPCPPPLYRTACADTVECSFLLGDAVAEIERLRRQIAGLEATLQALQPPKSCDASRSIDSSLVDLSKATAARRSYAVAAIGDVRIEPAAGEVSPPSLPPPPRISSVVTNLGTMMDVLM